MRNKKGALGEGLTWIVAFVLIFLIILIFFVSSIFITAEEARVPEGQSIIIENIKSLYAYIKTLPSLNERQKEFFSKKNYEENFKLLPEIKFHR